MPGCSTFVSSVSSQHEVSTHRANLTVKIWSQPSEALALTGSALPPGTRLTYGDLRCVVESLSFLLEEQGSVGILSDEGPITPIVELAVLFSGCLDRHPESEYSCGISGQNQTCRASVRSGKSNLVVPLDPTFPGSRLLFQLSDGNVRCIVTSAEYFDSGWNGESGFLREWYESTGTSEGRGASGEYSNAKCIIVLRFESSSGWERLEQQSEMVGGCPYLELGNPTSHDPLRVRCLIDMRHSCWTHQNIESVVKRSCKKSIGGGADLHFGSIDVLTLAFKKAAWLHEPSADSTRSLTAPGASSSEVDVSSEVGVTEFPGDSRECCTTLGYTADPLYLIYTSGTTGQPKAVVGNCEALAVYLQSPCLSKKSSSRIAMNGDEQYCLSKCPKNGFLGDTSEHDGNDDGICEQKYAGSNVRVLLCSATTWDPSISDIFSTFTQGATLVLEPRARLMADLAGCIENNRVTHVLATPALWRMLSFSNSGAQAEVCGSASPSRPTSPPSSQRLRSLRVLQLGGESWRPEELFLPANLAVLHNIYGVTECTVYQAVSDNLMLIPGTRGGEDSRTGGQSCHACPMALRPINSSVQFSISDEGELLVGGTQVLDYFNRSGGDKFDQCVDDAGTTLRWFRTGDRVQVDRSRLEMSISIAGRMDRQVKINGFRVELDEIEATLASAPLVETAVCALLSPRAEAEIQAVTPTSLTKTVSVVGSKIAGEDASTNEAAAPKGEPWLVAFVHRHAIVDTGPTPRRPLPWADTTVVLRHFCESRMPRFQIPRRFIELESVPLTATGKVDRRTVIENYHRVEADRRSTFSEDAPSMSNGSSSDASTLQASGFDNTAARKTVAATEQKESETEVAVLLVWRDIFPGQVLSARSHFFELGGTSVDAVQMVRRITATSDEREIHRRLCGLINQPRLREYCNFLDRLEHEASADRASPAVLLENLDAEKAGSPAASSETGVAECSASRPAAQKKKKIRRKRRDLASGLQRHTVRMLQKQFESPQRSEDLDIPPSSTAIECQWRQEQSEVGLSREMDPSANAGNPVSSSVAAGTRGSGEQVAGSVSTEHEVYAKCVELGDSLSQQTMLLAWRGFVPTIRQ